MATREADLANVARILLDTFDPVPDEPAKPSNMFGSLFGGGGGESSRERRSERLAVELAERVAKGSDIHILEDADGTLLGSCDLSEQEMKSPFHPIAEGLYLSNLAVRAGWRRLGCARELLEAVDARAEERHAECIWMWVERSNVGMTTLATSCGYYKCGSSPMYDAFRNALDLGQEEPVLWRKQVDVNVKKLET